MSAHRPQAFGDDVDPVDVTSWAVIRDEPGGRDPNKRWLAKGAADPPHDHWLWKSRQCTGGDSEPALTDCAEVFVSRLATHLHIPAAVCRFAVCGRDLGVISCNVTPPGFSLNTGAAYLPEIEGYARDWTDPSAERRPGRMGREPGYTLSAVMQVLDNVAPPPGISGSAFEVFAGYLVLDALVGNSDRHPSNWALLESDADAARYLAPTFDHGSALGAGLTEANRTNRKPEAFAARGRANPFVPKKQLLVTLAHEAISSAGAGYWLDRVAALDRAAVRATLEAPPDRLSDTAATFIERVVLENRRRLCGDYISED